MQQKNLRILVAILILTIVAVWIDWPSNNQIKFNLGPIRIDRDITVHQGLDLQGGMQVLLEADMPGGEITDDSMQAARRIIENRVNGLGVSEPVVQLQGDKRIIVELPGIDDPEQAIRTFGETGLLEFVDAGRTFLEPGTVITTTQDEIAATETVSPTEKVYETIMVGTDLRKAEVGFDNIGRPQIEFELTPDGADIFADFTANNVGKYLAIAMDKRIISCPVIRSPIPDGRGVIQGGDAGFDLEQAKSLVIQLKYGALPVPLKVIENRTIGPSLGQDSVQKSITAGAIGLGIVLLFMVTYYALPGLIADLALIIYGLLVFATFKLGIPFPWPPWFVPVTLTMPGVAGFLLSVGTAVDANILIFERMKEELRAGKNLNAAISAGFDRAWTSIRDSNLSTLITCAILYWFGTQFGASIVKGFAITLGIGVIISMFTAITVSRTFLQFLFDMGGEDLRRNKLLLGIHEVPEKVLGGKFLFDLVGKRRWFFTFSGVLLAIAVGAMVVSTIMYGAPVRPSIDFTGGAMLELEFEQAVKPADILAVFTAHEGLGDTNVQTAGEENIAVIRTKQIDVDLKETIISELEDKFGAVTELRYQSVGPTVGREVTSSASTAIFFASVVILGYIVFAFRRVPNSLRYGICAILAMVHNVVIIIGIYALFGIILGWEIDALFLTAILTVVGFSVQDTIVVFDRVRENYPKRRGEPFETVVNRSLLETLHRSLATQLNAIFVLLAILLFGGVTIKQFVFVMLAGMLTGTYSSLCVAVPLLVVWEKGEAARLFRRVLGRSQSPA